MLDPFRNSAERRLAQRLLADYENDIELVLGKLAPETCDTAVKLAALPEKIRGYGHVREADAVAAAKERAELQALLQSQQHAVGTESHDGVARRDRRQAAYARSAASRLRIDRLPQIVPPRYTYPEHPNRLPKENI